MNMNHWCFMMQMPILLISCLGFHSLYFTTKRLHEQYRVSSGQYRWIYCPLVPEGSIKFSVMPAGNKNEKKCFFSLNLTDFNKLFLKIENRKLSLNRF